MTTPAHDAPLVFPSVAFRPSRLLAICVALTAAVVVLAAWLGHTMFGVFFGIGLGLGLLNAVLVQRSVASITADAHPLKRKMALNSATRLLVISAVGLTLAFLFRPLGLGVVFGLALFQVVLVASTALPVWKKIRSGEEYGLEAAPAEGEPTPANSADTGTGTAISASHHDKMPKD